MGLLALKYRSELPEPVARELDQLVSAINDFQRTEHKDDGSHGDVVVDSLAVQGATLGSMTPLSFTASSFFGDGSAVWTVGASNVLYFNTSRTGQLVFVQFNLQGTVLATDTSDSLYIRLPDIHAVPYRDSAGSPAYHTMGILNWSDHQNGTNGIGLVSAQAQDFSGAVPSTILQLDKCRDSTSASSMFGDWPVSNDLWISGSGWLVCEPNNVATPYYGS